MTSPSELTTAVQEGAVRAARAMASGAQAFARLLRLAEELDSGQARRVARFLASTYDGETFAFDLFDLRAVDVALSDDKLRCLDALRWGRADLHTLVPFGEARVQAVIEHWGLGPPGSR